MRIEKLGGSELPPMELLLLADPSRELVEDYVRRGQCYVARADEGRIIGVYVLLATRPHTAEIVNVAVEETCQGQGIGRQLIQHAIGETRAQGFKTVEIGTGNSSVGQLALYQKCGFRITGVDRDFFLRHYREPLFENGMQVVDMIRLAQDV